MGKMRYVLCFLITGCVSFPVWSPDWRHDDPNTTVVVSKVYYQSNGTTLTVIPPCDGGICH